VKLLSSMSWPGNVRELENLIERLAIFTATDEISAAEVERERARRSEETLVPENSAASLPGKLEELERQEILRVLRESGGNKSLAARKLGIERKTLYEKARRLGIDLQAKEA
jgi:DNA-binding NtrC family response regulator